MDNKKTGNFIAQCRKDLNLSQKQLAEKLSVTDKAVSKWETGNGAPDIALLIPLADELGVTVVELLDGARAEKSNEKEQIDKVIIQSLQETKKERVRVIVALLLVIAILFLSVNIVTYAYWGRRHKVLYDVDTVYVHQREKNPNIYDLYYNVTVKNWWFDFTPHTYKLKDGLSGEPGGWHFEAETEYFTTSNLFETDFIIHVEYDEASVWEPVPTIEDVVRMADFNAHTIVMLEDERARLYMQDFEDAQIIIL